MSGKLVSPQTADRIKRKLLETAESGRRRNARGSHDEHETWVRIKSISGSDIEGVTTVRMGNGTWLEFLDCKVVSVNGGMPAVGQRCRAYQTGADGSGRPQYAIDVASASSVSFGKLYQDAPVGGYLPAEVFSVSNYPMAVPARTTFSGLAFLTFTLNSVDRYASYYAIGEWVNNGNPPSNLGSSSLVFASFALQALTTNQTTIPFAFVARNNTNVTQTALFGIRAGGYGWVPATNQVAYSFNTFPG